MNCTKRQENRILRISSFSSDILKKKEALFQPFICHPFQIAARSFSFFFFLFSFVFLSFFLFLLSFFLSFLLSFFLSFFLSSQPLHLHGIFLSYRFAIVLVYAQYRYHVKFRFRIFCCFLVLFILFLCWWISNKKVILQCLEKNWILFALVFLL